MNFREIGFAIPVFAALAFGTLSIASLPDLPNLSYDSLRYLSGAESILESGRYRIFNSETLHWPPGTSLLIAYASMTLGLDLKSASISLNFVSYVIAGWCLYFIARLINLNPVMSCIVVCTVLINSAFLSLYDKLWSEPIFLMFLYSLIVFLILYIRTQKSIFLFIASCLLGCAIVVRYAGIGFIPILMFAPWLTVKGTVKIAKISLGSLVLIVLPSVVVAVVLHVDLLATPPGTVYLYGILYSGLLDGITQMSEQILPRKLFGYFSVFLFLITFIGMPFLCLTTYIVLGIYYRKGRSVDVRKLDPQLYYPMLIVFLAIVCYLAFLILSKSTFYNNIPLDSFRILSPVFPLILIVGATGAELLCVSTTTTNLVGTTKVAKFLLFGVGCLLSVSALRSIKFAVLERFL